MRHLTNLCAGIVLLAGLGACEEAEEPSQGAVVFSNFRLTNLDGTRVDIEFNTDVPTSCLIRFGSTMSLVSEASDPDMAEGETANEHAVPLEDLAPGTTYYYLAEAITATGEGATSEVLSFQTLASGDTTAGRQNVALLSEGTRVVEVSSNYAGVTNDKVWGIDAAFDGSMASEWSSNGDGSAAFVEIDFGQTRDLTTFAFRSRKMNDGTSITREVQLRTDDALLGPFRTENPDQRYVFDFDAPVSTRAIVIEYLDSTGGNTGAKEIEFYQAD